MPLRREGLSWFHELGKDIGNRYTRLAKNTFSNSMNLLLHVSRTSATSLSTATRGRRLDKFFQQCLSLFRKNLLK